jgi:hypothetical protein
MEDKTAGVCQTCLRVLDLTRKCKDCGSTFSVSWAEQIRFQELGFPFPVRCSVCRDHRRNSKSGVSPLRQADNGKA